jgi:hypothetical protein
MVERATAATTHHVYVAFGLEPSGVTPYVEPWQLAEYSTLESDCNSDGAYGDPEYPNYGGWWHCDSEVDPKGQRYYGLDLHVKNSSGVPVTSGREVWAKAFQTSPAQAARGIVRYTAGCDSGVRMEFYYGVESMENMFLSVQYLHIEEDERPNAGVQMSVLSGMNSLSLGRVDNDGCYQPHLHQAAAGNFRNTTPTHSCYLADENRTTPPGAAVETCNYLSPWSGSPPSKHLFHATYTSSSGGGGGGGGK